MKKNSFTGMQFVFLVVLTTVFFFMFSACRKSPTIIVNPPILVEGEGNGNGNGNGNGEGTETETEGEGTETETEGEGTETETEGEGTETETEGEGTEAYQNIMASLGSTTRVNFDGDFEDKFPADEDPFFGNWFYENNMLIEEWDPISTSGFEGFDFPGADIFDTPIKEGMVTFKVNFPDYPDNTGFSPEFYIYADVGDDDEIRVEFSTADGSPDFWPPDFDATGKKFVAVFIDGLNSVENPNAMIDISKPHEFSVALINKGGKYQVSAFIDKLLVDVVDMDFGPNDIDGGFRFSNLERIRTWINPVGDEPIDNVTVEVHWIEYTPTK